LHIKKDMDGRDKPGHDEAFELCRFRFLSLQPLRCIERGRDNALVAGAPAEIAGDGHPHLLFGRVGIVA
jgi:hypothetical protein